MNHQTIARNLSNSQRRFLIKMIDGPHPYIELVENGERHTRAKLFAIGFLRHCTENLGTAIGVSPFFCLTEDGRRVVCFVLAEYAEALIIAEQTRDDLIREALLEYGYGDGETLPEAKPTDALLDQLKAVYA